MWQGADGSLLTIRCLAAAGKGAECQNFQKGFFMFLLNFNVKYRDTEILF